MSYIQNKLDEFDKQFIVKSNANTDLLRYTDATKIKHFINQSLTDYHNHTVEKWEHDIKLLKLIHKQELDSIALKSLEDFMEWSELRKSLQDTNPKE